MRSSTTASSSGLCPMLACSLLTALTTGASGQHTTTLFTDIPDAVFLDIATDDSGAPFGPFIISTGNGPVTTTSADEFGSAPAFFGFFNYNDSPVFQLPRDPTIDPGDYHGYLRNITPSGGHVVLNFDTPLSGFGLTFVVQRFFNTPDQPDTIYAYDGPDATGNLIATVTTVGAPATNFKAQIDFVGLYVDGPPTIRSAFVAGGPLGPVNSELRITGIAVAISDTAPPCPGDIADDFGTPGADGMVSFGDFLTLLGLVGPCPGGIPGCDGDIADDFGTVGNEDGQVSFGDFLALLGLVGPCP